VHATEFYRTLFGPREGNAFGLDPSPWQAEDIVTSQENSDLTKPFLEEEIKVALFQMEKNKAARPDGIPIEFYQHCWEMIKGDMLEMFNDFYCGTMNIKRLNYGIITLLPKVKDAEKYSNTSPNAYSIPFINGSKMLDSEVGLCGW
jgi:hypothetical protein